MEGKAMFELALEMNDASLLRYCKKYPWICQSGEFWRSRLKRTYKGVRELNNAKNARYIFESIENQLNNRPDLLPVDPLLAKPGRDVYLTADLAARESYSALEKFCVINKECYEDQFWKNMMDIFYPYIRGQFEQYKEHYYPTTSWKDFYFEVKHMPTLLHSGFY